MRTGRTTASDIGGRSTGGAGWRPFGKCPQLWRWVRWVTDNIISMVKGERIPLTLGHGGMQGRVSQVRPLVGPPSNLALSKHSAIEYRVWTLQPKRV